MTAPCGDLECRCLICKAIAPFEVDGIVYDGRMATHWINPMFSLRDDVEETTVPWRYRANKVADEQEWLKHGLVVFNEPGDQC